MEHRWDLRCRPPAGLFAPVAIDPTGRMGPTRSQAYGVRWRRVGQGLFVPATVDRCVVEQRILEESVRLPPGAVVSGWAALRLHGAKLFDGLDERDGRTELPVPVVLPPGANTRPIGVERHREHLSATEIVTRCGVRCASALRATFDAMRWAPDLRSAVVAGDMAVAARLLTLDDLRRYVDRCSSERRASHAWNALLYVVERSRSPQETRMRLIWVIDAGLPRPRCNWPVADLGGHRIGRPDLLCEELAVAGEYDGADHRDRARHAVDVRKEDAYRDVGLECFRVVGVDLADVAFVVDRMQRAVRRATDAHRPPQWLLRADPGPL